MQIHRVGQRVMHYGSDALRYSAPRGGAAAIPWYLSGGIAAANCIAAYQPKGAASLAASYDNLAAPGNGLADGTYDAAPGVAPTWTESTGWAFNGSTQYLTTGITPTSTWSVLVQLSNVISGDYWPFGSIPASLLGWGIVPQYMTENRYFNGNMTQPSHPSRTSGVWGMAGRQGYFNGIADGGLTAGTGEPNAIWLGDTSGDYRRRYPGNMQAFAIYNTTLNSDQVAAVATAMAAL
jgi:hypothetical protein